MVRASVGGHKGFALCFSCEACWLCRFWVHVSVEGEASSFRVLSLLADDVETYLPLLSRIGLEEEVVVTPLGRLELERHPGYVCLPDIEIVCLFEAEGRAPRVVASMRCV